MGYGDKKQEWKSQNVIERLEKVESGMIVKKSEMRKEVKSTNEHKTRKKRMMIFNLNKKEGKSDVECVKNAVEKMGAHQSCDNVVNVVIETEGKRPIVRPIILDFRSEYDKWTVIKMKTKLREYDEYRSVLEMDLSRKERKRMKTRIRKLKNGDNPEGQAT